MCCGSCRVPLLNICCVLKVDQAQLETVLPSPGGKVCILKGPQRGTEATLERIDTAKFQAEVSLASGEKLWLDYEDISKLAS